MITFLIIALFIIAFLEAIYIFWNRNQEDTTAKDSEISDLKTKLQEASQRPTVETLNAVRQANADLQKQLKQSHSSTTNVATKDQELNDLRAQNQELQNALQNRTGPTKQDLSKKDQQIANLNDQLTQKETRITELEAQNSKKSQTSPTAPSTQVDQARYAELERGLREFLPLVINMQHEFAYRLKNNKITKQILEIIEKCEPLSAIYWQTQK